MLTTRPTSRRAVAAVAAVLALSLAACSGGEGPAPTTDAGSTATPLPPEPAPTTEVAPTTADTVTETEEVTEEPEATSRPLAGGPVLAVKIDHVDAAAPRFGIGSADVVYVDEVEYGLTRLVAIFSTTLPEAVGPIRSARPNDPVILANYGESVPLAFAGSSRQTKAYLARGSQINVESGPAFYRDNTRYAPHNLLADPAMLLETAGGSEPPEDVGFRFGRAPDGGEDATRLTTSYPAARLSAEYDEDSGAYEVSTNGRVEIDALTNRPVEPRTIVVQRVRMVDSDNVTPAGSATPLAQLVGSGEAIMLRDGQAWTGEWSREGERSPTEFTIDGEELTFAPGQLWIWLVSSDQGVTVE